ncbi:hypothetical protein H5410_008600 [Solanum commersonii]|uniref:Uncharacterized protein n=1 Tax=Solanum commersonii TaxID=4109 RepID=A0A9J6AFE7_SOLCO|nr:hypothetical protein H5410_008600 [Solanum commersonii]
MKCSLCKTFGHNKKGCPTLKIAGTSYEKTLNVAARTSAATAETNATTSNFTNASIGSQSSVNADSSAGPSAKRPTNASSSGVRPATALSSGERPTSATSSDVVQLLHKKDQDKKKKQRQLLMVSYLDQVAIYKPNGLRWNGRTVVTQKQLQEETHRKNPHHYRMNIFATPKHSSRISWCS